ncbi:Sec-independent protein translocase protein TatB [Pseudaeromonas sp. ZJS20]|uniref:Sec-independent protein translocase protein TatB n=1 Tax=Pseudaeromonas aegiceratis TaxID=3153928 RepID=UPI00390C45A6
MFDIGFWELALVAVIGLLVLGPERLPAAVRLVARWLHTARSTLNNVKQELDRELQISELQQQLKEAQSLQPPHTDQRPPEEDDPEAAEDAAMAQLRAEDPQASDQPADPQEHKPS